MFCLGGLPAVGWRVRYFSAPAFPVVGFVGALFLFWGWCWGGVPVDPSTTYEPTPYFGVMLVAFVYAYYSLFVVWWAYLCRFAHVAWVRTGHLVSRVVCATNGFLGGLVVGVGGLHLRRFGRLLARPPRVYSLGRWWFCGSCSSCG